MLRTDPREAFAPSNIGRAAVLRVEVTSAPPVRTGEVCHVHCCNVRHHERSLACGVVEGNVAASAGAGLLEIDWHAGRQDFSQRGHGAGLTRGARGRCLAVAVPALTALDAAI